MADDEKEKKGKKAGNVTTIKYMGSSDVRKLRASDDFGGRLQGGFGYDVEFSVANNHTVDFEGIDSDALELLLEEQERNGAGDFIPAFADVTDARRVPENEWQKRWRPRGLPSGRNAGAMVAPSNTATPSGASVGAGPTTTAGGSGVGGVGPGGSTV